VRTGKGRRSSAKVERPIVPRWNRSRDFIRAGFRGPSVVLVDRFDCRSRRAARGQVRPSAMSTRKRPRSSRPLLGAGWRKSVGSRVQGGEVLTPVAVLAFEVRRSERGGGPSGQLVEGRRLGSSELQPLTGLRGKRSWRRVTRPLSRGRRARREMGRQRSMPTLRLRSTMPRTEEHPSRALPIGSPPGFWGARPRACARALYASVEARGASSNAP